MDYNRFDSSGTDDDLPPPHQHRFARNARVTGNGRSAVAGSTYPRMPTNDMETRIHFFEQEAYCSVLRAFKAQSDTLTWEKESLITELRKELRVSVEEHRDSLSRVNSDDMIKEIRDRRQSNGHQQGIPSPFAPVRESVPSPTVSASRKKQKTGQSVSALAGGGALTPANGMQPSLQPSSSNLKCGPPPGSRGKKAKESMPYSSPAVAERPQVNSHSASDTFRANDPVKAQKIDQLIGKRIDPKDIRCDGEEAGQGRGSNKSLARGRSRGTFKGVGRKGVGEFSLLNTDVLLKEVDNVFSANNPDPMEVEKAKKLLKEHEEALAQAIAMLQDASDGESDGGDHPFSQGKSIDREQGWRKRKYGEMGVEDAEHQNSLSKVNNDDMIKRLRDLRQSNEHQQGKQSSSPVHESVPSPTVSAPLKKQKTSHSVSAPSDAGALPPPDTKHPSLQSSSSKLKPGRPPLYPTVPRRPQGKSHSTSGTFGANEPDKAQTIDQHIGKKVWIRWPVDNTFYEALITDYKEGLHALVYDMNTKNESWEWLNLKEISPKDIRWDSSGQGRSFIRCLARGGGVIGPVRGRGKGRPKKNFRPQFGKNGTEIKLSNTKAIIKKVEEIFSAKNPDPTEVEKANIVLNEHERALSQAIALLEDASDGESDGEDHPSSQGKSMDREEQGCRKRKYNEISVQATEQEGPSPGTNGDKGRFSLEEKIEA